MPSPQPDLFAAPVIPGLQYMPELVSPDEADTLLAKIAAVPLDPFRFHEWTGHRKTASFGWRYDFEDASFAPAEAIPDFLLPLRDRAARFAGLTADALVQLLVTQYDPGAGIGWHRDRPVFDHVVGISLGAAATMRLRRRREGGFDRRSAPLDPGSAYHLWGEVRHGWEHSIAPMEATRWSITLRSLSAIGLRSSPDRRPC